MIAVVIPPLVRLARARRTWVWCLVWASVALLFAVRARHLGLGHGSDDVLLGVYAMLVLPFISYVCVRGAVGPGSLARSIRPLVSLGATRWKTSVGTVAVAATVCAVAGGSLGAILAWVAHGSGDPPVLRDALLTAYAGALGGVAYGCVFVAASRLGGWGAAFWLIVDWLLGAASGAQSLAVPRAHVRNLLGGMAPMGIAERTSALWLLAIAAIATGFAVAPRKA